MSFALRIILAFLMLLSWGQLAAHGQSTGESTGKTVPAKVDEADDMDADEQDARADAPLDPSVLNSWKTVPAWGGYSQPFGFPWHKFAVVLVGLFVWLRALRLCVDDERNQQLQVGSKSRNLFVLGLTGTFVSILLRS